MFFGVSWNNSTSARKRFMAFLLRSGRVSRY